MIPKNIFHQYWEYIGSINLYNIIIQSILYHLLIIGRLRVRSKKHCSLHWWNIIIYIYIIMYTYIYMLTYIYIYTHIYIYTYIYTVYIHIYMYIHICDHTHIYIYIISISYIIILFRENLVKPPWDCHEQNFELRRTHRASPQLCWITSSPEGILEGDVALGASRLIDVLLMYIFIYDAIIHIWIYNAYIIIINYN